MRKLALTAIAGAAILPLLGVSPAGAHTVPFNCPGAPVACGFANADFAGTTLFNKSTVTFGAVWEFTDDLLSSVNNDTSGARLCLQEDDLIDFPWIGVPAGVSFHNLAEQGVNNVTDYVLVRPQAQAC